MTCGKFGYRQVEANAREHAEDQHWQTVAMVKAWPVRASDRVPFWWLSSGNLGRQRQFRGQPWSVNGIGWSGDVAQGL